MYDLILFCVGKRVLKKDLPKTKIYIETEKRYCDIWKFITKQKGTWLSLYKSKDEFAGTGLCLNLEDDIRFAVRNESYAAGGKEFHKLVFFGADNDSLTPYRIDPDYIDDFKTVVDFLLNESPCSLVYVLASYQCEDKEHVSGTYTLKTFLSMMEENKIKSNVCYIITNNKNAL